MTSEPTFIVKVVATADAGAACDCGRVTDEAHFHAWEYEIPIANPSSQRGDRLLFGTPKNDTTPSMAPVGSIFTFAVRDASFTIEPRSQTIGAAEWTQLGAPDDKFVVQVQVAANGAGHREVRRVIVQARQPFTEHIDNQLRKLKCAAVAERVPKTDTEKVLWI
jgi:hypothetical protein